MHQFKDNYKPEPRTWEISLNVTTIKRVREVLNINLLEIAEGKVVERLSGDPETLANVIYVVCREQAEKTGVSDEEFGRGLAGDVIADATNALLEELIDFFPDSRRRTVLRTALEKSRQMVSGALEKAQAEVEKLDIGTLLAKTFGESSGSLPESSASIPVHSP